MKYGGWFERVVYILWQWGIGLILVCDLSFILVLKWLTVQVVGTGFKGSLQYKL